MVGGDRYNRFARGKERRNVTEVARGKVVGVERRDVTDSVWWKVVFRERRVVTDSPRGQGFGG